MPRRIKRASLAATGLTFVELLVVIGIIGRNVFCVVPVA